MKKILLVFTTFLAVFMFSCSAVPNDKPVLVYTATDSSWVSVYDSIPVYLNGVAHTTYAVIAKTHPTIQRAQIEPTWGQSFYYAFKYGYTPIFIVGLLLFFIGVLAATLDQFGKLESLLKLKTDINSYVKVALFLVFMAAGAITIYSKPGNIRWNNKKDVTVTYLDQTIKEAGSSQPIWDSLEVHNLIIGASHK